jgi:hypothetical protein
MFDFTLESPETVAAMTPMEQNAATHNVLAIQLALHAELARTRTDAALTTDEQDAMLVFAAEITESAEA